MTDELERMLDDLVQWRRHPRGVVVDIRYALKAFEAAVRRDERASMRDSCGDTRLVIGTRLVCRNCGTAENRNIPIPCAARTERDGGTG